MISKPSINPSKYVDEGREVLEAVDDIFDHPEEKLLVTDGKELGKGFWLDTHIVEPELIEAILALMDKAINEPMAA